MQAIHFKLKLLKAGAGRLSFIESYKNVFFEKTCSYFAQAKIPLCKVFRHGFKGIKAG